MAAAYASAHPDDPVVEDDWEDADSEADDSLHPVADALPSTTHTASDADNIHQPSITIEEDVPEDIYRCPPPPPRLPPLPSTVHPHRAVYLVYMLVIWLHTQFKLPYRACHVVLVIMGIIFSLLTVNLTPRMLLTLEPVLSLMEVEPTFYILPVCPVCKMPHPVSTPLGSPCMRCGGAIFNTAPTPAEQRRGKTKRTRVVPLLRFPYKPIEQQLAELIPQVEDQLDKCRTRSRKEGEYIDHFDGRICKELEGPDGLPFFRPDLTEMPNGELRIGITAGFDWYVHTLHLENAHCYFQEFQEF